MGVASHLGIRLADYDRRIRTFIPSYEEFLDAAAGVVSGRARTIVDLGIGTGALAARCAARAVHARVVGIDADAQILTLAARRLGPRTTLVHGDLQRAPLPAADAIVASLSLHHLRSDAARSRLFERIRRALRRGGVFATADCYPAAAQPLAADQRRAWRAHLTESYTTAAAAALLRAWAREDRYVTLEREIALLRRAGLRPEVVWRRGTFAVISSQPRT